MDGFTLVDGVVAALIVISALLAYSRGFVREAMAIAGWIGSAIVAFIFADKAQPLVKQIPVLGDFIGDSCELSVISAFAAVFAIALVIFSIFSIAACGIAANPLLSLESAVIGTDVPVWSAGVEKSDLRLR